MSNNSPRRSVQRGRALGRRFDLTHSRNDIPHNLPMHVGQPEVSTGISVGKPCVIEAEQVQDRGVQVMDMHRFFDGLVAEIVGRAVDHASLDAAAGQPDGKAPVIVVATPAGSAVDHLDGRRPAELAAAENQRLLEQPALFEVGQQCRDPLIAVPGQVAMVFLDVVVAVPGLRLAMVKLDESHAALDQAAGDQELPRLHARPVGLAYMTRLLLDVEGVGGGHLHAVRQLEAGDPRVEGVIFGTRPPGAGD